LVFTVPTGMPAQPHLVDVPFWMPSTVRPSRTATLVNVLLNAVRLYPP